MSKMGICPACNREIKLSSKFCKYCGTSLKSCPDCKSINTALDQFCGSCGVDISQVEAAEPLREIIPEDSGKISRTEPRIDESQEIAIEDSQSKLVVWPPMSYDRQFAPPPARPDIMPSEDAAKFEPKTVKYAYGKVRILGFLGGPLPTSNVISATVEAFGLALALVAGGIGIASIGLAFFEYLIPAIIAGIIGGALLLSAPFFGIYYVSSSWLYRTFQIKRPTKARTMVGNYALSALLFSFLGLMLAPIFIQGLGAVGITLAVVGGIVYLMGLIIVPLKAYLADLVYVKAAINLREKEEKEKEAEKLESQEDKEKKKTKKTQTKKKKK